MALIRALFGPNGLERDELLLLAALALIARGFWIAWQPGAYLVPGLVILWIVMPARDVFVAKPPASNRIEKPEPRRLD